MALASFSAEPPADVLQAVLAGFAAGPTTSLLTQQELGAALRLPSFERELDSAREALKEQFDLDRTTTLSVAGVSFGVSVVYVLWLVRGGVLLSSYLSALPAWRLLDPLPILSRVSEEEDEDDDALDARARQPVDPLRGIG